MGTTNYPEQRQRELIRLRMATEPEPKGDHSTARRVGFLGTWAQCETCGQVCQWVPGPFLVTSHADDGTVEWERVAAGYFGGPPDDRYAHRWYVWETGAQDNTDAQAATPNTPPSPRPAGISAAAVATGKDPAHRKGIPSRSPEARRAERERARRRARL